MYRITHVIIGFGFGLLLSQDPRLSLLYGFMGGLGGYIPDIDLRFKHRKTLHNIILSSIISLFIYVVLLYLCIRYYSWMQLGVVNNIVIAFLSGWILHILTDSLTKRGVYILYPLSNYRLRIPIFKSSSLVGNTLFIILSFIMYYFWIRSIGLENALDYLYYYLRMFLISAS
ncbi:membrane-bound metal-dependent hydrolase [Staphylothermus marinus F1]|uniref:Membrane-bound metal-dependent hydrolase n=1 Tax=Staphylothermus marinus (strain ATCC 43588 / DSM 3639 / JCM 9404 / F1) TaxID=399550 RepID=A3DP92_STAMF|nr:metal-dependent hydrolase [Staphylothermus marinus]ABN70452.1 membrane-bound metal-dependent hydrolase [Staphylothermus marinus F1]